MATTGRQLDTWDLEARVKDMYREVAEEPHKEFHFETGRALAERLGYPIGDLDRIPAAAIDSFAGVGFYFDLAAIRDGETVLDRGSGSGTDSFIAALHAGPGGRVIGVDMTEAARALAPGGRLALADIVTAVQLPEGIICDAALWAACIGGARQRDRYLEAIETAGFELLSVRENPGYRFVSERAANASRKYGVASVSLLARRR